jgi:hypothetical protein
MQWRQSVLAFDVWIDSFHVEQSNDLQMPVLGCDVQWRETPLQKFPKTTIQDTQIKPRINMQLTVRKREAASV